MDAIEKKLGQDTNVARELGRAIQDLTEIVRSFIQEKQEVISEIATLSAEMNALSKTVDKVENAVNNPQGCPGNATISFRLQAVENSLQHEIEKLEELEKKMQEFQIAEAVEDATTDKVGFLTEKMKTIGIVSPGVIALLTLILEKIFEHFK